MKSLISKLDAAGITYREIGPALLVNGDGLEVLPMLEAGSVDCVVTDPPYGIGYVTTWRSRSDRLRCPIANDQSLSVVAACWPLVSERLKDNAHWYVFVSPRRIAEAEQALGKPRHIICWDKGDEGSVGDLVCGFGEAWEAVFYGMKGRRPLNGKRPRTVFRHNWSAARDPVHPTVKPVPLLERMIELSTHKDEVVLDPFLGSGTTAMACIRTGRRCIGIEISEDYFNIACKRVEREWMLERSKLPYAPPPAKTQPELFQPTGEDE